MTPDESRDELRDESGAEAERDRPPPPGVRAARETRMAVIVEAFLREVRSGGSLDPEPFLALAPELRGGLQPLLLAVLRLEASARAVDGRPRSTDRDPRT